MTYCCVDVPKAVKYIVLLAKLTELKTILAATVLYCAAPIGSIAFIVPGILCVTTTLLPVPGLTAALTNSYGPSIFRVLELREDTT